MVVDTRRAVHCLGRVFGSHGVDAPRLDPLGHELHQISPNRVEIRILTAAKRVNPQPK